MLFNYVQEAYLSGYGSVVEEFLPEAIKGDPIITEGTDCTNYYSN